MEHIGPEQLSSVCANMRTHLLPSGLAIMSISASEEVVHGANLHQTVEGKTWWLRMFQHEGFTHLPEFEGYFNNRYVRGPKQDAPHSFHLILSKDPSRAPRPSLLSFPRRLLDAWYDSRLHRALQLLALPDGAR